MRAPYFGDKERPAPILVILAKRELEMLSPTAGLKTKSVNAPKKGKNKQINK